jgi:hypothetical protein
MEVGEVMAISDVLFDAGRQIDKCLAQPLYQKMYASATEEIAKVRSLMDALRLYFDVFGASDPELSPIDEAKLDAVLKSIASVDISAVENAVIALRSSCGPATEKK